MTGRRSFLKTSAALATMGLVPSLLPGLSEGSLLRAAGTDITAGTLPMAGNRPNVPERILPPRLKEGDRIGLVTPGSSITEEQLQDCVHKLEEQGFRSTYMDSVLSEYGYFAGRDQERADELMEMFTREDVDAIWCVRGGYGSIRILDLLWASPILTSSARNPSKR